VTDPGLSDPGLSDRDRKMLAFEHRRWKQPGAREQAIHDEFGLSSIRYHQLLTALLDRPAAREADPLLVGSLTRQRDDLMQRRRR
jgi:hypothetical protein